MTIFSEKILCPCCQREMEYEAIGSYSISHILTDLRGLGAMSNTPWINECNQCHYVFYDKTLIHPELTNYVKSQEYRKLFDQCKDNYINLLLKIYQKLKQKPYKIAKILLYKYYTSDSMQDFKTFIRYAKKLNVDSKENDFFLFQMLIVEYYRRQGMFCEAIVAINKLKDTIHTVQIEEIEKTNILSNLAFQEFLIEKKITACCVYTDAYQKNYDIAFPLVDNKIIDRSLSQQEIISDFIEMLDKTQRYDEFEKGIEILKEAGIDIAKNDDIYGHTILFDILNLWDGRHFNQDAILHMFEVALLKYGVDPTCAKEFYETDQDNDASYTFFLRVQETCDETLWKEFSISIRELLFLYAQKLVQQQEIKKIPKRAQHLLLAFQISSFENFKLLYEKYGYRLSKKFRYPQSIYYDNFIEKFCYAFYWQIRNPIDENSSRMIERYLMNMDKH